MNIKFLRIFLFIPIFLLANPLSTISAEDKQSTPPPPPYKFDYSLFDPVYSFTVLDIGNIYTLSATDRPHLNLEHSAGLLTEDIRMFHPSLVTSGQQILVSSLGHGSNSTRLLWRGRPSRDIISGQARFDMLPLHFIGSVSSAHYGALDGIVSTGSIISYKPLDAYADIPTTMIYHRDGYYDYAPVEFIHTRRIGKRSYFTGGGCFPASVGRFYNSEEEGHTLLGEWKYIRDDSSSINISYMDGMHRVGRSFTDVTEKYEQSDLDISLHTRPDSISDLIFSFYNVNQTTYESGESYSGNEVGAIGNYSAEYWALVLRISQISGQIPESEFFGYSEIEGSVAGSDSILSTKVQTMIGFNGIQPDRIYPTGILSLTRNINGFGELSVVAKQAVDPHSPQTMFSMSNTSHRINDIEPAWRNNPDLPLYGRILPVTINRSANLSLKRPLWIGLLNLNIGTGIDYNYIGWTAQGDSVLSPTTIDWRKITTWSADWIWRESPFRTTFSIMGFSKRFSPVTEIILLQNEPGFRLYWESGWHKSFWNNQFETDLSLSGTYYSPYTITTAQGQGKVGGAYPLDARFTARIHRFSFFYGLHNWNAYPYYLIPGYKMMHKEEYYGIHWTLLN